MLQHYWGLSKAGLVSKLRAIFWRHPYHTGPPNTGGFIYNQTTMPLLSPPDKTPLVTECVHGAKVFTCSLLTLPLKFHAAQMEWRGVNTWPLQTAWPTVLPPLLGPAQRDSSRILKGLPRVFWKVSYMLPRASFQIIQSVSQPDTQAQSLFNYLFRNVSPSEKVSSLRVRSESYSSETPKGLAQYTGLWSPSTICQRNLNY